MWKLLFAVIVMAVLSTYADADRERGRHAISNRRLIQRLEPPNNSSVKRRTERDVIVIGSEFLGYNYSTPKPPTPKTSRTNGYTYPPGGYVYVIPAVKLSTPTRKPPRSTKPSPPGTTYLPPEITYLPPTTMTPITSTLPPRSFTGYEYLPPRNYLPAFITRK